MRLEVAIEADVASIDKQCIRELTLAMEFLATALRAVADGHKVESQMVQQPFLFAHGKVNDLATVVYRKAA